MSKRSVIERNKKRKKLVAKYEVKRRELKTKLSDVNLSFEEKLALHYELQKLPRDSSKIRVRNRCNLTGRPRGVYQKFGISRIKLRELAMSGNIPGIVKSSW